VLTVAQSPETFGRGKNDDPVSIPDEHRQLVKEIQSFKALSIAQGSEIVHRIREIRSSISSVINPSISPAVANDRFSDLVKEMQSVNETARRQGSEMVGAVMEVAGEMSMKRGKVETFGKMHERH